MARTKESVKTENATRREALKNKAHEVKRAAANARYEKNKSTIQKNRIIKELELATKGDFTARKPSIRTLKKYGMCDEDKQRIIIDNKFITPKINYMGIEPDNVTPQTINIITKNTIAPIEKYDPKNTKITGKEIKDFVYTVLANQKMRSGNLRGKKTIDMYGSTPRNLFMIYNEKYNEDANIANKFMDATTTLEKIADYGQWKTSATEAVKILQEFLFY